MFHVEPPKSQDVNEWLAWMERDKLAGSVAKRQKTMTLEHGDIDAELGHIGIGFEGDWENGKGEIVASIEGNQETAHLTKRKRGGKKTWAHRRWERKQREKSQR